MHRFDLMVMPVRETRRAASAVRAAGPMVTPEGLGGAPRPHCGAVAGMSSHGPMT